MIFSLKLNHLQKVNLFFLSALFATSCTQKKDIQVSLGDFYVQNVDNYDYCGYGNISFTLNLSKADKKEDKLQLSAPSQWCSIKDNLSCGKVVTSAGDSIGIIVYPLTGYIHDTKSLYLANNTLDTVRLMFQEQFYEYSLDSMNKWLTKYLHDKSKLYLFNKATGKNIVYDLPASVKTINQFRGINDKIDTTDLRYRLITKYPRPI